LETEQAHSPNWIVQSESRNAVAKAGPWVWLNLVCLDAPIVALAWLWLFARTFQIAVDAGIAGALFLTAWLIYLGDRLADSYSLLPGVAQSLRQRVCRGDRRLWIGALFLIANADVALIWRSTDARTFSAGAVVGLLALLYLALNHSLGRIWRSLPLKEFSIGFLFAAGVLVALRCDFRRADVSFVLAAILFACLCILNCIGIAAWERDLDLIQDKVSIATRFPSLVRHFGKIAIALAAVAFTAEIFVREIAVVSGCVIVSALLLALLNASQPHIGRDARTALADLVLLTPLFVLVGLGA